MDPLYSTLLHAAYWGYILLLVAAAVFDIWKYIIPNSIPVALAVLFVATALLVPFGIDWISHIALAFATLLCGLVLYRFRVLGGGDIKLIVAVTLWTGLEGWTTYMSYAAIGGGALALSLLLLRRLLTGLLVLIPASETFSRPRILLPGDSIPFGVAVAGAAIVLAGQLPLFGLIL